MKNIFIITLALFIFSFTANAQGQNENAKKGAEKKALEKLTIITGSTTGTYYTFANDIKNVLKDLMQIEIKESTGSIDNIRKISTIDNTALAVVQSDVFGFLMRSKEPESKNLSSKLSMVIPFYVEEVHLLVRKDIKSIKDLNGKSISVGAVGSGSWLTANNLFSLLDIKPNKTLRLTPERGIVAVLSGEADAVLFVGGKPVKLFENLASLSDYKEYNKMLEGVHFLDIDSPKLEKEYLKATITKADYNFVKKDVKTVAVMSILVSYNYASDKTVISNQRCDTIRQFRRLLQENLNKLKQNGHKKWKEVDLDAEVGFWKRSECGSESSKITDLENEFLLEISK